MPEIRNTPIFRKIFHLALLMVLFLPVFARAIEAQEGAKAQPGKFQVKVSQGYLSLAANQTPLTQIFEEIGKQAKITFDSNIGLEEKITIRLDRVPLEEGIKQLAKNATVFYVENPKDKTRRITRVVVLAERSGVPEQVKPPSQPEKAKEAAPPATTLKKPVPQPESFKFEFDPAKAAEQEKVRKQP